MTEGAMTPEERNAKYTRETEELYAAIGRFAVKFEHVSYAMQDTIQTLLKHYGLSHRGIGNAILAGLTADPLLTMLSAVIAEVKGKDLVGKENDILKAIRKRIRELIENRNDIIHRRWFVG